MLTEQITVATEIRAFGTGKPTPTRRLVLNRIDYVVMEVTIVLTVVGLYGLAFLKAGLL